MSYTQKNIQYWTTVENVKKSIANNDRKEFLNNINILEKKEYESLYQENNGVLQFQELWSNIDMIEDYIKNHINDVKELLSLLYFISSKKSFTNDFLNRVLSIVHPTQYETSIWKEETVMRSMIWKNFLFKNEHFVSTFEKYNFQTNFCLTNIAEIFSIQLSSMGKDKNSYYDANIKDTIILLGIPSLIVIHTILINNSINNRDVLYNGYVNACTSLNLTDEDILFLKDTQNSINHYNKQNKSRQNEILNISIDDQMKLHLFYDKMLLNNKLLKKENHSIYKPLKKI